MLHFIQAGFYFKISLKWSKYRDHVYEKTIKHPKNNWDKVSMNDVKAD